MEIDLVRIEPAEGRFRFYRLALWPDLFGGVSLVREWGRLGNPGRLRCDHHDDPTAAEAALKALRRRKLSRGYREVA
jgi:predicted DNA-binding WGR domain protein